MAHVAKDRPTLASKEAAAIYDALIQMVVAVAVVVVVTVAAGTGNEQRKLEDARMVEWRRHDQSF